MHDDIVVYEHPNPHMRSFFISVSIWPPRVEVFHKSSLDTSRDDVKSLGNIGARMAKELLEIPGLRELMMRPGEILVKKDRAVAWQNIEPEVLKILQRALRKYQIHLVKR
jgi:Scaffold protein Nfu/NifU N terminal